MTIEFKLQSVTLRTEDIQKQFPNLISAIRYYSQSQKLPKRRKRKKKKTVGMLIDEIQENLK